MQCIVSDSMDFETFLMIKMSVSMLQTIKSCAPFLLGLFNHNDNGMPTPINSITIIIFPLMQSAIVSAI
jgi:hypothetical protein